MKKSSLLIVLGLIAFTTVPALAAQAADSTYGGDPYANSAANADKRLLIPAPATVNNAGSNSGAINVPSAPVDALPAATNGMSAATPADANKRLAGQPWQPALQAALRRGDFNQVNVIAASNPANQGAIALYLLDETRKHSENPETQVKIFNAAAPFVSQVPPADADKVIETTTAMLQLAANPTFAKANPNSAADVFYAALIVSSQPNVVGADPTLHSAVLEAADDFLKTAPEDADKRLRDEVNLAEAGGAPTTTPRETINPSQE